MRDFEDSQDLKLVEAISFENGVALLRYEIKKYAGSPHFGNMPLLWVGAADQGTGTLVAARAARLRHCGRVGGAAVEPVHRK